VGVHLKQLSKFAASKQPILKLKTQLSQLLGYLPLAFTLPSGPFDPNGFSALVKTAIF
jgi:hypothetical protein